MCTGCGRVFRMRNRWEVSKADTSLSVGYPHRLTYLPNHSGFRHQLLRVWTLHAESTSHASFPALVSSLLRYLQWKVYKIAPARIDCGGCSFYLQPRMISKACHTFCR